MKKISKILFIIFILILVLGCCTYIDYFIVKRKTTYPKIALKKEISSDLVVYNAIFYRVWYCGTNKTYTIGDYEDVDAVCPKNYTYKDGYYTNTANVKISKKDLEMINDIYTSEMIENMVDKIAVENAVYVASNYGQKVYKNVVDETGQNKKFNNYQLVSFPKFELNTKGDYEWVYDNEELYCLNDKGEISLYLNDKCTTFEKIKMDSQWCKLYINSTLAYNTEASKLCEE